MSNLKTVKKGRIDANKENRPDLDGEEWRDGAFYKPISTREYFKLLGYCMLVFVALGLSFMLFFL